jgi:ferric-dicitrate binding protein FerR (iron transport regulator)
MIYPSSLSGNTREVSLQGEALFEVAKDARHPFVIHCGELTTTVLGTSFNIRSDVEKIEVTVLTGKVSLASVHDTQGVIVLPNEKVIYDGRQRPVAKAVIAVTERSALTGGTEYTMDFNDTRMSEVIGRIERKFDRRIAVADARLGQCRITADFSDQSLERTISMIAQALGVRYEINDRMVTLLGKGCD